MDINELQRFTGTGHNILLSCYGQYGGIEWYCKIEAKHEGTRLEVTGTGPKPEDAVAEAARKFDRATFFGLPEMNPQITYDAQVEEPENSYVKEPDTDDGVPF